MKNAQRILNKQSVTVKQNLFGKRNTFKNSDEDREFAIIVSHAHMQLQLEYLLISRSF